MFRRIRHPIYAFSILLMLCTMVIVPTVPMLAFGVVHIGLMVLKARNEERHLLATHGEAYARYLASTGRFVPRFR
jgi:protein-S-isoprenylcysteine O-methyltransferase Ste14